MTRSDASLPLVVASTVPVFLARLGVTFVRLKAKRRAAVRRFRRALLRGGMAPALAERLVADYEAMGRLRSYLPGDLKFGPLPFRR